MTPTLGWRHFRVIQKRKIAAAPSAIGAGAGGGGGGGSKDATVFLLLSASCQPSAQLWLNSQVLRDRDAWAAGWLQMAVFRGQEDDDGGDDGEDGDAEGEGNYQEVSEQEGRQQQQQAEPASSEEGSSGGGASASRRPPAAEASRSSKAAGKARGSGRVARAGSDGATCQVCVGVGSIACSCCGGTGFDRAALIELQRQQDRAKVPGGPRF